MSFAAFYMGRAEEVLINCTKALAGAELVGSLAGSPIEAGPG